MNQYGHKWTRQHLLPAPPPPGRFDAHHAVIYLFFSAPTLFWGEESCALLPCVGLSKALRFRPSASPDSPFQEDFCRCGPRHRSRSIIHVVVHDEANGKTDGVMMSLPLWLHRITVVID